MKHSCVRVVSFVVLTAFIFMGFRAADSFDGSTSGAPLPRGGACSIFADYEFAVPAVVKSGQYDIVVIDGLSSGGIPGCPSLPVKDINILIPYGYRYSSISTSGTPVKLDGAYSIKPAPRGVPLSMINPPPTVGKPEIYSSADPYPESLVSVPLMQGFRGFTILSTTIHPVQYAPATGGLVYYPRLHVSVVLEPGFPETGGLYRGLMQDFADAAARVDNPYTARSYPSMPKPLASYDLLIVTMSSIKSIFQTLADWKNNNTFSTRIATVEDIEASSPGNDTQQKIRNYIKSEYTTNGISYVILGGDTGSGNVPHRDLYCNAGGGLSDNIPCDLYYSGLDGTWDKNGDGT
jgi:hypothetical protein